MGITGTFEGSASATLVLKNSDGTTGYNGWKSSPTKTNSWGSGTSDYGNSYTSQYISYSTSSGHDIHILGRFSEQIILTPYKVLHVLITTISSGTPNCMRFGVGSPSMTGNSFSSYADLASNGNSVWYSINISGLSGNYCIFGFLEDNGGGSRYTGSGSLNVSQAYLD